MDIKPSNIVLDKDDNAILIDISGIGGMTYEWRAPEIRDEIDTFSLPFENRRLNDIWAYGMLLERIAEQVEENDSFVEILEVVAEYLTRDVRSRWTLSDAISLLEGSLDGTVSQDLIFNCNS